MQANAVYFTEEEYGFNKAQVTSYIQLLMQEYRVLQQEHEIARQFIADALAA